MRVCVVLPDLRPSGGVGVVLGLAEQLRRTEDFELDVLQLSEAGRAMERRYDVALATWWETVPTVLGLQAGTHVMLVQSAEERFYRPSEPLERLGAALALTAPLHFFVVAPWLSTLLAELRPDARTWHVPVGIDKALFKPSPGPRRDGPLRILIEGQHSLWFKGVDEALDVVGRMSEPREVTLISLDPEGAPQADGVRVMGGLDASEMRAQYADHDVLLKLSRVESLGIPLVEACHVGVPCVVTAFTGHEEVIRHGENGLVFGFDDPDAVAQALDRLASDRGALERLSDGAVRSMVSWPTVEGAAEELARALREAAQAPPPAPAAAPLARWRAAAEVARVDLGERDVRERELAGSISWLEAALTEAREKVETMNVEYRELAASRDEATRLIADRDEWLRLRERQIRDLEGQLTAIRESRPYRAARAVRRVGSRIWR